MTTMDSTLGLYMAYKNSIESVAVKARATEETELRFKVWMPDENDQHRLDVYSSSVHLLGSKEFHWVELPINLYSNSSELHVEIERNPKVEVDDETFSDCTLTLTNH